MKQKLAEAKKAIAAAAGVAAILVAVGAIHGQALEVTVAVLGVLTTLGVYQAKNVG